MQIENYTIQLTQNVNSVTGFRIANETIDKYNWLCNVWEPPGEQPTPLECGQAQCPRGVREEGGPTTCEKGATRAFPGCIWILVYQHFL